MRILLTIFISVLILSSIYSQCLYTIVDNTFSFECISGEPNGARIGIDSVVYIATGTGTVEVAPSGIFGAFKNGIYNESFSYDIGDAIKIKPISNGLGAIALVSQETGCFNDSYFVKRACTISLPVVWLNKSSSKLINMNQTEITWFVASQINNEKYIIEHSKDGKNFSPIGEIAGDGTNNETKHYEYIHTSPSIGVNYYRIKQVDYDGKYSYSDIASVRYDGNGETNIYPNPATSEVTITITEPSTLKVMDVYGRVFINQDISEGQNTINLSELAPGFYVFLIGDQRYKVLKE